jgi:2-polyprenyl-3-methyl-5-hydroxy-6-metoxy-1,4-benzoquinol methylase
MASMIQVSDDDNPDDIESTKRDNDTYYFSSYSHSSIHETMLQDRIRTEAYQNAIINNPHIFKDKIVMDIGCGTSILSLFAAKAGAKKVIAVDASDVYKEAREIIELNGYSHIITVVHGKVEDLIARKQLPLEEGGWDMHYSLRLCFHL